MRERVAGVNEGDELAGHLVRQPVPRHRCGICNGKVTSAKHDRHVLMAYI
jgi:hypothetical protein